MKISTIPLFAILVSLTGCVNDATRYSIPVSQKNYRVVITHAEGQAKAFSETEVALAQSFNDLTRVLQLKQPDTGIFLLKPVVTTQIGGPLGGQVGFHYTLKIKVSDDKETLDFEIGTDNQWNAYPSKNSIPNIRGHFRALASEIASGINGEIQPQDAP